LGGDLVTQTGFLYSMWAIFNLLLFLDQVDQNRQ